jgi:gluconokinase
MSANEYILGVDIGTTSTKAMLFTPQGKALTQAAISYGLLSPAPDIQEQDPDEILAAVVNSVRRVIDQSQVNQRAIAGLSFSAAMHSLIAVDRQGNPLTRIITWADRRSAAWAQQIRADRAAPALYHRTGTPIHAMTPLVKLVWLRHEHPGIFEQSAKFISIKEYILHQWFNDYVVDYSIASGTGLFNMTTLDWDREALDMAGISRDRLSTLVPTTHVLRGIKAAYAEHMGVPEQLPVVVGAGDGALANLGVGAIQPGLVAVTVGTSGAVRTVLDHPCTDPEAKLFCYALTDQHWVVGGAVNNGGLILRWVRDTLGDVEVDTAHLLETNPYDILTAIAATVPAGAAGLIFHPYLAGERSPLWDADARGSFFGLALHHRKAHMIRAVLEGIVYNLNEVLEALRQLVGPVTSIRATGGFARSELWRQMLADVFNQEVLVPESYESSCWGAAILGLYALARIPALEQASTRLGETYSHQPIASQVATYQKIIPLYSRLREQFQPLYGEIARVQADLVQDDNPVELS